MSERAVFWVAFVGPNWVVAGLLAWNYGQLVGAAVVYGACLGLVARAMYGRTRDEATAGTVAAKVPAADD